MIGRRMLTAGVVVAAVTAGGVAGAMIGIPGLSGASSSPTVSATAAAGGSGAIGGRHGHGRIGAGMGARRDLIDAAAKALKLSTADLLQKLSDGKTTIADVAKQQNVKISDVIDAMDAVAKADISNIVNNPFPVRPHFGDQTPLGGSGAAGPDFPDLPKIGGFGIGFGFRGGFGASGDAVAKALGISQQDLLGDLRNGQSIADIAKAKHVDLKGLIKTLTDDAKAKIDAEVKAGHLPQAVATKLESDLEQMITKIVNDAGPKGLGGFGFRGGRGGHRGYDGGAPMPNIEMPTAPPGPTN